MTQELLINWLKDADRWNQGGAIVYSGPAPYDFANTLEGRASLLERPWAISHPEAKDKLYRAAGIECNCITLIPAGMMIGVKIAGEWQ